MIVKPRGIIRACIAGAAVAALLGVTAPAHAQAVVGSSFEWFVTRHLCSPILGCASLPALGPLPDSDICREFAARLRAHATDVFQPPESWPEAECTSRERAP